MTCGFSGEVSRDHARQPAQYYATGGPFGSAKARSTYRYLTTEVQSGVLLGDWLPIEAQSFSRVINGAGTLTGYLDLLPGSPQQNIANIQAVTPRKAVYWVLQDGVPIWSGVQYDWIPQSVLQQQLSIQASTMDSILAHRIIDQDLVFTGTDVFDMARSIIQFAFSKTPAGAGNSAQVAGITYSQGPSGIVDSLTFDGTQNQLASDALNQLVTSYGIEYAFRPYMDSNGNLLTNVDLGYPALGLPYPASGLAYTFPGNLLDYEFTATGSTGANRVIATASAPAPAGGGGATTAAALTGSAIDLVDIANGFPLSEMAVSATGVNLTSDAQLDSYAAGVLPSVSATQLAPLVILGNGQQPEISITQLGSYASVAFTSSLHPAKADGSPGFTGTGRVVSWTGYPPSSQQAEYYSLQLGSMPFEGSGAP